MPGRERAHVNARVVDRVHPDPIAEERAARLALRWIDREDRHRQVTAVGEKPPYELVDEARLARPTGSRDPEDRNLARASRQRSERAPERISCLREVLRDRDERRDRRVLPLPEPREERREVGRALLEITSAEEIVDHPDEPHRAPVVRRVDPRDPVGLQLVDLGGENRPSAPPENFDPSSARVPLRLPKEVDHVLEVLDVPALVRRDRDPLHVLLDRTVYDLAHGAVVPEVNHLGPRRLHEATHHVDRRIVTVEQRRGADDPEVVARLVGRGGGS